MQISQQRYIAWSETLPYFVIFHNTLWVYKWTVKVLIRMHSYAGWSGPSLPAYAQWYFAHHSPLFPHQTLPSQYLLKLARQFHCAPASVAQLDAPSDWRPGGRGFNPRRGRQHSFVEIDHKIFSTVILSLPLIQEGQLSVSGERMCTILVNRLED